jgi:FMN phosphatase YigB (HAD superfamily)
MKLTDYKVLTFDCYGTLIDWEAGIWDALQPLLMANGRSDITRLAALESHAILEHKQESETPGMLYTDLLTSVHRAFSRAGFAASNRKLGVEFDAIYTAEDIGSYKPAAANFEYLFERLNADLGLAQTDILHTAQSLFHDHVPAKKFGLANAWIDRRRLSESGDWGATAKVEVRPDIDFLFFSMGEMAEAVKGEST